MNLLELKEKIENKKEQKAELEAEAKVLMQKLKKDHGCTTLKAAETKIKKLNKMADKKQGEYDEKMEKLEELVENGI